MARPSTGSEPEGSSSLTPEELSDWLEEHRDAVAERWLVEIRSRGEGPNGKALELLREFAYLIASFLSPGMGAHRAQVEALFQQAAELYGNLGAHRGQAAGESVEEFQLLREVLLRFLHDDPPAGGSATLGLRDILRLSRLIDLGVTYASIGHTDTLFFQLFHGAGGTEEPALAVLDEVREQVSGLREELDRLALPERADGPERAN